jgi:hypothetical protein
VGVPDILVNASASIPDQSFDPVRIAVWRNLPVKVESASLTCQVLTSAMQRRGWAAS